jgi:hypothetical protein
MAKFNVGDIIVGNDKTFYHYTTDRCICKVVNTYEPKYSGRKDMDVEVVYHADVNGECKGETYEVCSKYFDLVIAAPIKKTKKTKEMTVSEISKALGYEVKIVKDSTDEYYF